MNKLTIIGNLTRDPEKRTISTGSEVCSFTVAVNKRRKNANGQYDSDFIRVSAWNRLADNCMMYLKKGYKVCVMGPVSVSVYQTQNGETRAQLEMSADDVEFLTSRAEAANMQNNPQSAQPTYSYTAQPAMSASVDPLAGSGDLQEIEDDELPF